ncbi:MAG: type II toxin-antitoxin system Phd/YefM family antitoxin [Nitrososphaera sp.]|nr:type II toxin-antitoxin system Phd/YefM family antitoxin [Nitrososphaera sp.]
MSDLGFYTDARANTQVRPYGTVIYERLVMKHRGRKNPPQIVLGEDGEPSAVILDIEEYRELLERLEDAEDLRTLKDFLVEYS